MPILPTRVTGGRPDTGVPVPTRSQYDAMHLNDTLPPVSEEKEAALDEHHRRSGETTTRLAQQTDEKGWQDFGNCLGTDPELFFPERGASTREAKEVCKGCVVREDCLEYALANGEKFGIWGGLSERERRRIRRQRAIARRTEQELGAVATEEREV